MQFGRALDRLVFRYRVRRIFHGQGISFISQNCTGSRFSRLAGEPYLSPTVDLWFHFSDFLLFVADLPAYLRMGLREDAVETARFGYPVGRLGELPIMFQHYPTFEAASVKWMRRRTRVRFDRLIVLANDGDVLEDELAAMDRLPYPKLIFTARSRPRIASAVQIATPDGTLPDLYSHWEKMAPVLNADVLMALRDGRMGGIAPPPPASPNGLGRASPIGGQ